MLNEKLPTYFCGYFSKKLFQQFERQNCTTPIIFETNEEKEFELCMKYLNHHQGNRNQLEQRLCQFRSIEEVVTNDWDLQFLQETSLRMLLSTARLAKQL